MIAIQILIWTCVAIFVFTGVISLLSLINVIKIDPEFRKKLFYALILEVVAVGLIVFKKGVTEQPTSFINIKDGEANVIRIFSPTVPISINRGDNLFVNGFCFKSKDVKWEGEVHIGDKLFPLQDFKVNDRSAFSAMTASITEQMPPTKAIIVTKLVENEKLLSSDTAVTTITVN